MDSSKQDFVVFAGNSNPAFVESVCKQLASHLNNPHFQVGDAKVSKFSNGERSVEIKESIRGKKVFLIQSMCLPEVDSFLMELLIMADACKRASAGKIIAVIPCYGYARQDKKTKSRDPITAKLVAKLLETAGVNHVITMDLHAPQIQGFFEVPVDNLFAEPVFKRFFKASLGHLKIAEEVVVVSPDAGGVKRAKSLSDGLGCGLAIIHKERKKANEVESMTLVGTVENKVAIIIDDMADTCGTLTLAATTLKKNGAKSVSACCTHGVLSGNAIEKLESCNDLEKLYVTNTNRVPNCNKIECIDVSELFARAIILNDREKSVSVLFI